MKVESLLQREGRGPVERTGPIPLPGRRPRHSSGRRVPVPPTAGAPGVDPDADTDPVVVPKVPGPAGDPAVPRTRVPRPTPPVGIPAPTLSRGRPPRPGPPRRVPAVVGTPGQVAVADRPRWWPLRRRARGTGRLGRTSHATVLIALAALAAALGAAGIAVAAWLSSGSGRPGVTAGTALAPTTTTVAGSAVTAGLLAPGATGTAIVTVTNPNPYKVTVVSIGPNGDATASGGVGTCATTGVSFTVQSPGVTLAAKASTTLTLPGAVAMSTASETGCQGATFSVPVTVGVASTP